jgi:hypothetical protein
MTSCNPHISHINLIYFHPIYITTKVVSSNPVCGEVIRFVTDLPPGQWFSPGTHVSSANKTDHCDIPEILFKVALNTINHKWLPLVYTIINCFYTWLCVSLKPLSAIIQLYSLLSDLVILESAIPEENYWESKSTLNFPAVVQVEHISWKASWAPMHTSLVGLVQQYFSYIVVVSFIGGGKQRKTTDL